MSNSEQIAIIGAGLMGNGIAAVFAAKGYSVTIYDPFAQALEAAPGRVAGVLKDLEWDAEALKRVRVEADLTKAVADADFVTEAALEKLPIKQDLFVQLAAATKSTCVLASNTSVIPITDIGAKLNDQDAARMLGTHWWNP
ncbi:MAG: 3-hydroxyacyl-CoA dehydrogenase family protein, partial [Burkholderiales bacterium]